MHAEIITVGNELLSGHTVDTNSAFMGRQLALAGLPVQWIVSVGDSADRLRDALETAVHRSEITLVTGGLGPTHDDITKTVFCDLFDRELVLDSGVLEHVRALFQRRGVTMPESNVCQAMVPKGTDVVHNRVGTAPGIHLTMDDRHVFLMPGVPREMMVMVQERILPILSNLTVERQTVLDLTLRTTGIGESSLFEKIGSLDGLCHVASLPGPCGVDLRITIHGTDRIRAEEKLLRIAGALRACIGDYVYGEGEETIEQVVGRELSSQGARIAVAESCTGGLLADRLTNVPGSSDYFAAGVVAYEANAKTRYLSVDPEIIREFGVVSCQVAEAMATGIRKSAGVEVGLATTGVMGPDGGTPDVPVGTLWIGLACNGTVTSRSLRLGDDRLTNKARAAQAALDTVRRALLSSSEVQRGQAAI